MTDADRYIVRAMLIAARFPAQHVDWMAASCPSVRRCREVCNEERRRR